MKAFTIGTFLLLAGTFSERFHVTNGFTITSRSTSTQSISRGMSVMSPSPLEPHKPRPFRCTLFVRTDGIDNQARGSPRTSPVNFAGVLRNSIGRIPLRLVTVWFKLRRSLLIVSVSLIIWLGMAGMQSPPSHAASAAASAATSSPSTPAISRILWTPTLDQIVEDYVEDIMFDDDVYDPIESVYREGMDDKLKGTYPKALKEITSSVLGQNVVKAESEGSVSGVGTAIFKFVGFLRQRGLTEMQAIALLAGSIVVAVPTFFVTVVMAVATQNKRSITRLMKKRYGDTYTVDATIKEDDDVELPDDDEDDDDNKDDDDDE